MFVYMKPLHTVVLHCILRSCCSHDVIFRQLSDLFLYPLKFESLNKSLFMALLLVLLAEGGAKSNVKTNFQA